MKPTLLVDLINQAQGDRTLCDYAIECGMSPSTLSRVKNSITDNIKPDTLKKLADHAQYNVTYEMLMTAAGYANGKAVPESNIEITDLLYTLNNNPENFTYKGESLPPEVLENLKQVLDFSLRYSSMYGKK